MDLLSLVKNTDKLRRALLNGDVSTLMAGDELKAARVALYKAREANHPEQQVWSAINHLEAAHERLARIYSGKTAFFASTSMYYARMAARDRYILCLMACCYFSLGEVALCKQALGDASNAGAQGSRSVSMIELLDPRLLKEFGVNLFGRKDGYFYDTEVKQVEAALL